MSHDRLNCIFTETCRLAENCKKRWASSIKDLNYLNSYLDLGPLVRINTFYSTTKICNKLILQI